MSSQSSFPGAGPPILCGGGGVANSVPSATTTSTSTQQPFVTQTLKRRATKTQVPLDERVTLERAYGFTINSNTRLAQSSCDGLIAYLAGCVIVLYDTVKQKQEFIISSARKTLTTVAFSPDGKLLATGESGHDPRVRVWDVKEKNQVCEFSGHKFSIDCVCFATWPTQNSSILVSIGSIHDMSVFVWNPKTKFKVASNKIACKVRGMAFSRDGSYFVTVGNRHVKFWYLTTSLLMETVPLRGRAAILGEYKNNYFCDVCCGSGDYAHQTYAITTNGVLCQFNENRCLCNTTDLVPRRRAANAAAADERAYCLHADSGCLFVGCSNGNIHIFRQGSLQFVASLPRPHHLGVDVLLGLDMRHVFENMNKNELKYPDCIALAYNPRSQVITAVYNDHSLYVWDIADLNKVKKLDSHLYHSSCCWSIDMFTSQPDNRSNSNNSVLPVNSFITCSTDNTLRIWSPVSSTSSSTSIISSDSTILKPNIYSKELLKVIYVDDDLTALCDTDQSLLCETDPSQQQIMNPMVTSSSSSAATSNATSQQPALTTTTTTTSESSKLGARCLKISPYGNHLATGDRNGNIRIYDLHSLQSICLLEAHEGEILYLQYSQPEEQDRLLLASSSRDRLIHIFDASSPRYDLIQTLDDHSAAITSVRFCYYNTSEAAAAAMSSKQLCVISCGADKSIMFRNAVSHEPSLQFARTSYVAEKQTFYDLSVDSSKSVIYTIAQDRMIREYNVRDGKRVRQFKGSLNEDGSLIKMDLNKAGTLLAVSGSDKCIYIWDVNTTECVAYFCGHSEVVTDLKFSSDSRHLITVSTDGCIFVWKLSPTLYNLTGSSSSTTAHSNPQQSHSQPHHHHGGSSSWAKSRTASLSCHNNLFQIANSNPIHASQTAVNTASAVNTGSAAAAATMAASTTAASSNNMNSLRHQQSLDTGLLHDQNEFWHDLPAWARNKLAAATHSSTSSTLLSQTLSQSTNSLSYTGAIDTTTTTATTTNSTITSSNRRSRAVWGPPVLNTSFAVQYHDQNNDLFETNSTSSMISNSVFHNETSFMNNNNNNDASHLVEEDQEVNGGEFIKEMMSTSVKIESEEEDEMMQNNNNEDEEVVELIQEEEDYEEEDEESSRRRGRVTIPDDISSIGSGNVEIERADSMMTIETEKQQLLNKTLDVSSATKAASPIQFPTPCIDKDFFHVRPVQLPDDDVEQITSTTSTTITTTATAANLDNTIKSSWSNDNIANNSVTTATEEQPMNDLVSSSSSPRRQTEEATTTSTDGKTWWNESAEFNLDCDFENSFRRQSLSARFMMKHQRNQSATPSDLPDNNSDDDDDDEDEEKQRALNDEDDLKESKSPRRIVSSTTYSVVSNHSPTTINRSTHLYNQHTESSLSKSKNSSRQPTASSMAKRWPSINSVSATTTTAAAPSSSSIISIKPVSTQHLMVNRTGGSSNMIKPHRTESSTSTTTTTQQQANFATTSRVSPTNMLPPDNLVSSSNNDTNSVAPGPVGLKKASSMTNVNASTTTSVGGHQSTNTKQHSTFVSSRPLPAKMSSRDTLPPKTTRSTTTGGPKTRTVSNNLAKSQPVPVTLLSTFSEQNNKIKKLSSSIQNLHKAAAAAAAAAAASGVTSNKQLMSELGSSSVKLLSDREDDEKKKETTTTTSSQDTDTDDQMSTASSQNMDDEDTTNMMMLKSSSQKSNKKQEAVEDMEQQLCSDHLDPFVTSSNQQLNSQNSMTTSSTSTHSSSSSSSSFCAHEETNSSTITSGTNSKKSSLLMDHEIINPFMKKMPFKTTTTRVGSEQQQQLLDSEDTLSSAAIQKQTSSSQVFGSIKTFKKPVTFASIATGSANTINILGSGATSVSSFSSVGSSGGTSSSSTPGGTGSLLLTNSKIETILKEFKENIYFFEMIYGQTAKNFEEYKKLHQTLPSQQTLQIMELFNNTCCSFVKQFKTVTQQQQQQQQTTTSSKSTAATSTNLTTFAVTATTSTADKMTAKKQLDAEIV